MPDTSTKILVVDDNPATLYSTSRVLRAAGWTVEEAASGSAAIGKAVQGVDLVVLDVNLPDFDGFEVCRRLRADEKTARTPVIHLSATFVADVDKVHGFEVGADGYLTHPVEPLVLVATVKSFLRTRQAENELRQSEAKFRSVFNNAINGIVLLSTELTFIDANPAMCQLLERPLDSLTGHPFLEMVPTEFQSQAQTAIVELRDRGAWRGILPLRRSDGELVQLDWNISRHSVPNVWLAVVSDVTDRIRFEREREELLIRERSARTDAERANQLKDEFLATLSHELRTPLNAIVGWSQLLKLGNNSPEDLAEGIDAIDRNARAQAQMIADLLDVSRIISGKLRLDLQSVDAAALVDDALTDIQPAADTKGVRITKVLDPSAGSISGDPARLQQVIWNLVSNAVKFTPAEGQIQVRLRRLDSGIEISVADTGIGFDESIKTRIFERFRQADSSTTRQYGGLGLGLAIAKQLVEMHGGQIHAASEGHGRGASFVVSLPSNLAATDTNSAVPQASADPIAFAAPPAIARLDGVRVLLVEDDADARVLLNRIITDSGAQAKVVDSVDRALSAIEDFRPHVLVSDLGMPVQDGFDLIREVRARQNASEDLPAIALTAFAGSEDRRRVLLAGYQVHIAKPVDPRELTTLIAALVNRSGVPSSSTKVTS